jgi:hypothetical protein
MPVEPPSPVSCTPQATNLPPGRLKGSVPPPGSGKDWSGAIPVAPPYPFSTPEPRTLRRCCAPEPEAESAMATPCRAYWKGYLKLSLVTCPIALYPASSQAEKTHFHQINRRTGHRLRQQMIDEKTGEVVEGDDKSRGYEVSKGKYVEIEPEEVKAIQVESTHTLDIGSFVPLAEIDRKYFDHPYYIVPDDKAGEEAFAVIRDAMKDKGRVALARIVLTNRELRGARCEGVRQGRAHPEGPQGDAEPCRARPRHQGRPLRSSSIQG